MKLRNSMGQVSRWGKDAQKGLPDIQQSLQAKGPKSAKDLACLDHSEACSMARLEWARTEGWTQGEDHEVGTQITLEPILQSKEFELYSL